jgi:hypothetical protein
MKNKKSFRVLWNVFLFVICGGSLIYGFVQQQRVVDNKIQIDKYRHQIDSLKVELEKYNAQLEVALKQLQVEKNAALSALQEAK